MPNREKTIYIQDYVKIRFIRGLLVYTDTQNYIDNIFSEYNAESWESEHFDTERKILSKQTIKELKNDIVEFLKVDNDTFNKIYHIFLYVNDECKAFSGDREFVWRDIDGNNRKISKHSQTPLLQSCCIKTKDGKLYYKENERDRSVLLIFGYNREIENQYTFNIPVALNKLCQAYYHAL